MSTFNKLLKSIILENNLSMPVAFPESFDYADYGLEFIFDIMPTMGPEYQWHTLEDLQSIPELINALQNSPKDVIINIANGFDDAADAEENEYIGENMQQPQNFREISRWIQGMAINGNVPVQAQVETFPQEISEDGEETENPELNAHDPECFNTVPNTIQERRPRPYRRGLKALSLANRHKFNKTQVTNEPVKVEPSVTRKVSQQPITKDTMLPVTGVNRPVKNSNTLPNLPTTFANTVYTPSITSLCKETKAKAKARCLKECKAKVIAENNDLEFTANNFNQEAEPVVKPKKTILDRVKQPEKMLCVVCKEYVEPKEITARGLTHCECPKCGMRLTQGNL